MSTEKRFEFDSQEAFLEKLKEMTGSGVKPEHFNYYTPFHVHEAEHMLCPKPSALRFFTLTGAIGGFVLSFLFIIYTVFSWPIIVGGKPLMSTTAFIIVAFECTILIGGIVSFIGFLFLSRLPNLKTIIDPVDCGNQFIIVQQDQGE